MPDHHSLDISIDSNGQMTVKAQHGIGGIPNLLGQFSAAIQQRAKAAVFWPSRHERRMIKATRNMPYWARATVRQYISRDRAERLADIEAQIRERREARAIRVQIRLRRKERLAAAREARKEARQAWLARVSGTDSRTEKAKEAERSILEKTRMLPRRKNNGTLSPLVMNRPAGETLTQRYAHSTSALRAAVLPVVARDRGRSR